MQSAAVIRIEKNVDRTASALFALACGYAASLWFAGDLSKPVLGIASVGAGAFAYLLSTRALGAVRPQEPRPPVPIFDVRGVEPMVPQELSPERPAEPDAPGELLLTNRVEGEREPEDAEEPLLLDDILGQPGSGSRVVRLFDPAAMPKAAEPGSRFDGPAGHEVSAAQSHAAAQALHDALDELRRSLR